LLGRDVSVTTSTTGLTRTANNSSLTMTIEIHGDPASISTKRVAAVFEEKKIPYKLIPVRLAKHEQKAPEHVANQPFGQVPFIVRLSLLPTHWI